MFVIYGMVPVAENSARFKHWCEMQQTVPDSEKGMRIILALGWIKYIFVFMARCQMLITVLDADKGGE